MYSPVPTRYVYFICGLVLILAGVVGVSQTSRGQEILEDVREELGLEITPPTVPNPPDLALDVPDSLAPELTITRRPGQFTGEQLLVLQNPHLADAGVVILAKDNIETYPGGFGSEVEAKDNWTILSQVPATIPEGGHLLWHPQRRNDFKGVFTYQDPFSGATYELATDNEPAVLLGYDSSFDSTGERFRYLWVPLAQISSGAFEEGFVLASPEIQLRTLNLGDNTYKDEALTLPDEVTTTRRSYNIFRDQIVFANRDEASDVFETYDLETRQTGATSILKGPYGTLNGRIFRAEEELGFLQLRPELRFNVFYDQPTPETLLLTTSPNSPEPETNIVLFDLETREFSIALENDYQEFGQAGRSQYALSGVQALPQENIYRPSEEVPPQTTVRLREYDLVLPEDEFSVQTQAENPELYASLLAEIRENQHRLPGPWAASSLSIYPASTGFFADTPPLRVKTYHYLDDLILEVTPKDGLLPGAFADFVTAFELLPEVLETQTVPEYEPGEGNLFVAFNPMVYEGGAVQIGGINESLESGVYKNALLTAEAQCYGGCRHRWVLLLEDETSYQRIGSADVDPELSQALQKCPDNACVREGFLASALAQQTRAEFLEQLRATRVIR